jgi:hypothetical protein
VRIDNAPGILLQFNSITEAGLAKDGTSMSQIPTYVTGVPNGTEKVSREALEVLKPPTDIDRVCIWLLTSAVRISESARFS